MSYNRFKGLSKLAILNNISFIKIFYNASLKKYHGCDYYLHNFKKVKICNTNIKNSLIDYPGFFSHIFILTHFSKKAFMHLQYQKRIALVSYTIMDEYENYPSIYKYIFIKSQFKSIELFNKFIYTTIFKYGSNNEKEELIVKKEIVNQISTTIYSFINQAIYTKDVERRNDIKNRAIKSLKTIISCEGIIKIKKKI